MPNDVRNWVVPKDPARFIELATVKPEQAGSVRVVDFNAVLPSPTFMPGYGETRADQMRELGGRNWYEWNTTNWGTKWNAYGQELGQPERGPFVFDTAWTCPDGVIYALALRDGLDFDWYYADEDTGHNYGHWRACGGALHGPTTKIKFGDLQKERARMLKEAGEWGASTSPPAYTDAEVWADALHRGRLVLDTGVTAR